MAQTLFRGPVLQGKFNEAGLTGYNLEEKSAAYTVANADSGKTFTSKSGDVTFTLPAITEGRVFTFVNTGADSTNGINFACNGAEVIRYAGANNAVLANTKATSKVGDFITIGSLEGGTKWAVLNVQGIFA
tara:strand:- start:1080 stop:1472 length:393 start_codon:yes stop_codon:yes gene_type:complete